MRDAGLRQLFQRQLPEFHWQSIETWSTGQGVPDLNYCHQGAEGWIEMKRVVGWRIHVEPAQVAWMERRARAGGRVFLAARRMVAPQAFWLFPGTQVRTLTNASLKDTQAMIFVIGSPAGWPWSMIAKTLLK